MLQRSLNSIHQSKSDWQRDRSFIIFEDDVAGAPPAQIVGVELIACWWIFHQKATPTKIVYSHPPPPMVSSLEYIKHMLQHQKLMTLFSFFDMHRASAVQSQKRGIFSFQNIGRPRAFPSVFLLHTRPIYQHNFLLFYL